MRFAVALCLLLALAAPAMTQDRSPAERQTLLELARTLGEAHGLRLACRGTADQRWRNRMQRLIELEAADEAFETRLHDAFNAGFVAAEAEHVRCDEATLKAVQRTAAKGRDLARRISAGTLETASR